MPIEAHKLSFLPALSSSILGGVQEEAEQWCRDNDVGTQESGLAMLRVMNTPEKEMAHQMHEMS